MTIEELNNMDRDSFVEALGWIFEHSPWVAGGAWECRPFCDANALLQAMNERVETAQMEAKLALLRAHPDLGTRARLTDASAAEQNGAGLDRLTSEEFALLIRLNNSYRERFGFPFLYAVKGSTKNDILRALEARLGRDFEDEFAEALKQVGRIAAFRLHDYLNEGD